ncbi:BMC domain-containing protein [Paenibacillus arenosi]|uniref:BMC domain-containing protein n=1 Tax=Paenibacillus arenosi TaxID=2774142 RepID=A0ABR9B039_9BACL|nr:BMC domain-containing protein [Paenibacillus arenosi]MBD8498561.1 BMC domain-containing protein [Paenibacillus arenosi]
MRHNALGLIEVRGYLGAIAAADAALKAANVTCIGIERVKDGFRMIKLSGDVGAVQSAVDAGAEIAVQLDVLVTRHVIARMHEETAAMILGPNEGEKKGCVVADAKASTDPVDSSAAALSEATPSSQVEEASSQMIAGMEETSSTLESANAATISNKQEITKELTPLNGKQETVGKPEVKLEAKPIAVPVKPTAPSAAKRSKHKKKASS